MYMYEQGCVQAWGQIHEYLYLDLNTIFQYLYLYLYFNVQDKMYFVSVFKYLV